MLPAWKAFIQLIFSLQGESKIGTRFSGKLLEPECPDCQPLLFLLQADCQLVSACSGEAEYSKLGERVETESSHSPFACQLKNKLKNLGVLLKLVREESVW